MTACRTPGRGRVEEEVVEKAGPHGHHVGHHPGGVRAVDFGEVDVAVDHLGEDVDADGANQRRGERVVDERVLFAACYRAGGSHHGGGGPDAGGQVPGVSVAAAHRAPP